MKKESRIKLEHAELFYKFSLAVSNSISFGISDLDLTYYEQFSFLGHIVNKKDLELTKSQERIGARMLESIGTYMIALQLNKVLEDEWREKRLQSRDKDVQSISQVVRLIRNAFAHDPLDPIWDISPSAKDKEFEIPGILTLKTHDLHGKRLDRRHYGGPLALLRLTQHLKKIL